MFVSKYLKVREMELLRLGLLIMILNIRLNCSQLKAVLLVLRAKIRRRERISVLSLFLSAIAYITSDAFRHLTILFRPCILVV